MSTATKNSIRRPRITDQERELAACMARSPAGVTPDQLASSLSIGRERAHLILSRLPGVTTKRAGSAAGRGARALIYHLPPVCAWCKGPVAPERLKHCAPGRTPHCSTACTNNSARAAYKDRQQKR